MKHMGLALESWAGDAVGHLLGINVVICCHKLNIRWKSFGSNSNRIRVPVLHYCVQCLAISATGSLGACLCPGASMPPCIFKSDEQSQSAWRGSNCSSNCELTIVAELLRSCFMFSKLLQLLRLPWNYSKKTVGHGHVAARFYLSSTCKRSQ